MQEDYRAMLSDVIKITCQKALLSQEEFANALNVSLASVSRWEIGKSIPNLSAMKAIRSFCKQYSCSYDEIEKEWLRLRMNKSESTDKAKRT